MKSSDGRLCSTVLYQASYSPVADLFNTDNLPRGLGLQLIIIFIFDRLIVLVCKMSKLIVKKNHCFQP